MVLENSARFPATGMLQICICWRYANLQTDTLTAKFDLPATGLSRGFSGHVRRETHSLLPNKPCSESRYVSLIYHGHAQAPSQLRLFMPSDAGDEHVRFADLTGLQFDPLQSIAGVIHLYPLHGIKLARRDAGLSVLRELGVDMMA
jgi:hypothetical protein